MDGIRAVVSAMALAIPAISEIFLVSALIYYIFAVLGVNLMSGLFLGCYSSGYLQDPYYLLAPDNNINRSWWVAGRGLGSYSLYFFSGALLDILALVIFRCEANSGSQVITNSYYHDSINVTVPPWQMNTTWGANGGLNRFDNVIMSLWVLFQVRFFTLQEAAGCLY